MHLPTIAYLPFSKSDRAESILSHRLSVTDKVQRRLSGRMVLTPDIWPEEFRFQAVIDWVEFRMHLGRYTQIQHLQTAIRGALGHNCA